MKLLLCSHLSSVGNLIKKLKKGLIFMNNVKERIKIFSGAQLKYIAFLSMLIDHTNKALIYPNLDGGALNRLSDFFDILGRIAFPIFIFLLVSRVD